MRPSFAKLHIAVLDAGRAYLQSTGDDPLRLELFHEARLRFRDAALVKYEIEIADRADARYADSFQRKGAKLAVFDYITGL